MNPPFLTAQWRHLAMVNFAVDPQVLECHVPAGTELDFFEGRTFVSLVGFLFLDTRVGGWAIPGHRNFEEVNLRFYVRRQAAGELRRGVVFIKEIVPRIAITTVARWAYGENYVTHAMRHAVVENGGRINVAYELRAGGRWNRICLAGEGPPQPASEGSEEHFITEHYWGYTRLGGGKTAEYHVAHPSWSLWQNCHAELNVDAVALYGGPLADVLAAKPASVLIADGSAVSVSRPHVHHVGRTTKALSPEVSQGTAQT